MNSLTIIGNLTRDPETRSTQTGKSLCSFDIAVNDGDKADFFKVIVWDKLGEVCQNYLAKGRKVAVSGPVKLNTYTGKDGKMHASMDVTARTVEFLSPKEDEKPAAKPKKKAISEDDFTDLNSDDLPF